MSQCLRDYCWRWLAPENLTGPQVAEAVVLEQFMQMLPVRGKEWVRCHIPMALSEAISLMEDKQAAADSERPHPNLGVRRDRVGTPITGD